MLLPDQSDPPRSYRLSIPRGARPWLTDNQRMSWRPRAQIIKAWRQTAGYSGRAGEVPHFPHGAHIIAELRFSDARNRDPNNWNPTAKACIDGLVDARIFADDNHRLVIGPDMRIGPVVPRPDICIVFHFWPNT